MNSAVSTRLQLPMVMVDFYHRSDILEQTVNAVCSFAGVAGSG
jgi:hypothetical protein